MNYKEKQQQKKQLYNLLNHLTMMNEQSSYSVKYGDEQDNIQEKRFTEIYEAIDFYENLKCEAHLWGSAGNLLAHKKSQS